MFLSPSIQSGLFIVFQEFINFFLSGLQKIYTLFYWVNGYSKTINVHKKNLYGLFLSIKRILESFYSSFIQQMYIVYVLLANRCFWFWGQQCGGEKRENSCILGTFTLQRER